MIFFFATIHMSKVKIFVIVRLIEMRTFKDVV